MVLQNKEQQICCLLGPQVSSPPDNFLKKNKKKTNYLARLPHPKNKQNPEKNHSYM